MMKFIIILLLFSHYSSAYGSELIECRDNIKLKVCLIEKQEQNPKCLSGSEKYVQQFESLFDSYPNYLKKAFCSLKSIYVIKKFFGSAYAGVLRDSEGNINGAAVGVKESLLNDINVDFDLWSSWKEQLSFGGNQDLSLKENLPKFVSLNSFGVNSFLYFIVAHEFGHILDSANRLNDFVCDHQKKSFKNCYSTPSSWGAFSWEKQVHYIPSDSNQFGSIENFLLEKSEFSYRKDLCFYSCSPCNFISEPYINTLYSELFSTNFISTYSSVNPSEDFAESLAYYTAFEYGGMELVLNTGQGQIFDVRDFFYSDQFQSKRKWLKSLLEDTELIYP